VTRDQQGPIVVYQFTVEELRHQLARYADAGFTPPAIVKLISIWVHARAGSDSFETEQLGSAYMMLPIALLRACGIEER